MVSAHQPRSCDCCGKSCATRVAVVMDSAVAMVGSSCARKFPRARPFDLIRSMQSRSKRYMAGSTAPQRLTPDDFRKHFPEFRLLSKPIADFKELWKWRGYGYAFTPKSVWTHDPYTGKTNITGEPDRGIVQMLLHAWQRNPKTGIAEEIP